MAKQNICIIGGGLTGLITAITLSKLNFKVEKQYLEKTFSFQNIDIDYYFRMSKIIQKRYDFKAVNFN